MKKQTKIFNSQIKNINTKLSLIQNVTIDKKKCLRNVSLQNVYFVFI